MDTQVQVWEAQALLRKAEQAIRTIEVLPDLGGCKRAALSHVNDARLRLRAMDDYLYHTADKVPADIDAEEPWNQ